MFTRLNPSPRSGAERETGAVSSCAQRNARLEIRCVKSDIACLRFPFSSKKTARQLIAARSID
jgi:hypothetical protein